MTEYDHVTSDKFTQAYKGYLIKLNVFTALCYISKDGQHIGTAKTIAEAKQLIDGLAD